MRLKVLNLQKPVAFYLKLIILCWLDPSLVYVAICMLCFLHHRHLSLHQSISTISTQSVEQCSVFRPCFTMFVFLAWYPMDSIHSPAVLFLMNRFIRERQQEINRAATRADGASFQRDLARKAR